MFIDTHAHTNDVFFKDDLGRVVSLAIDKNVKKIICVSTSLHDSELSLKASREYPENIFPAVGLYPHRDETDRGGSDEELIEKLEGIIKDNKDKIVAIGECGLDLGELAENETARSVHDQKNLFLAQIELALKYDLPIIIHCRKAYDELLEILNSNQKFKNLRGSIHFYTGGKKRIRNLLEFPGFVFGVAGPITYDDGLQQVAREIPLDKIVLETDSPLLVPLPFRGQRGEPAHIPLIAAKVAEIKGIDINEVERATEENTERVFDLKK